MSIVRSSLVLIPSLLVLPSAAHAYRTLANVEGTENVIRLNSPAAVRFDPAGASEAMKTRMQSDLTAAIEAWSLGCGPPTFIHAGAALSAPITVRFVDDWTERGLASDAAATTELAIETGEDGNSAIVGAVILVNAGQRFGVRVGEHAVRDLRAVLAHEFGHTLGLAHPCELDDAALPCGAVHDDSLMHPLYSAARRLPSADDVAGYCALYARPTPQRPSGEPREQDCEVDMDCDAGEWCIGQRKCARELRYGGACDGPADCVGGRCVVTAAGNECTFSCVDGEDCPAHTDCAAVRGAESERVCAPTRAGAAGCSAAAHRPASIVSALGLLLFGVVVLGGRRRWRGWHIAVVLLVGCASHRQPQDAETTRDGGLVGAVDSAAVGSDASDGGDARIAPSCTPEESRVAPCGFCGMEGQRCSASGSWEPVSECLGQGACAPAAVETEELPLCARRQRLCRDGCTWTDWQEVRSAGSCQSGETRVIFEGCELGQIRIETCSPDCGRWERTSECHDPCGGTARLEPEWAREVCVPAGAFVRGSLDFPDTQPVGEVFVSSYYIDRYPVTNTRYFECVRARACQNPQFGEQTALFARPERGDYPVQSVSQSQASAFCAWDGGRRLPTEAEWEKALRGPGAHPGRYPWPGNEPRCDLLFTGDCGNVPNPPLVGIIHAWDAATDPYDGQPGSESPYGTQLQFGGVNEWVSDRYSAAYYESPGSRRDPLGPEADGEFVARGLLRQREGHHVARRHIGGSRTTGFRCARSAR